MRRYLNLPANELASLRELHKLKLRFALRNTIQLHHESIAIH